MTTPTPTPSADQKSVGAGEHMERCGFCGRFFFNGEYLTTSEVNEYPKDILDRVPLGYCPEAGYEDGSYEKECNSHRVTRDMAIDACYLSLEGQLI